MLTAARSHLTGCPKQRRVLCDANLRESVKETFQEIADEFVFPLNL
jgi:hypothetical protein